MTETYSYVQISMLPNGHFKHTRNSTFLQNSTLVDAFFHIALCRLADNDTFRNTVLQSISESLMGVFITSYLKSGTTQTTLLARTRLLEALFPVKVIDGMRTMDCDKDLKAILEFLMPKLFLGCMKEKKSKCSCKVRSVSRNIPFRSVDSSFLNQLTRHQNIDFFHENVCSKCESNVQTTFELNEILFFVTDQNVLWEDVSKVAIFQNDQYLLSAVIEKVSQRHFVAHIMRPNKKWYTFDSSTKGIRPSSLKEKKINLQALCFVVPSLMNDIVTTFDELIYDQMVLQNFHSHDYDGQMFSIENSCPVDCILHCLVCLYIDRPKLFPDACDNDILKLLSAYAKHQYALVYDMRIRILINHFEVIEKGDSSFKIDCISNIKWTIDKVFTEQFPSLTLWCHCEECQFTFSTLDVDNQKLSELGWEEIQKCIKLPKRVCNACRLEVTNQTFGNILFVDTEPVGVSQCTADIIKIANSIEFNGIRFALQSVLEFNSVLKHYTINCLRRNNLWYNFDNLHENVSATPSKVNPHILIYAKKM